MIGGLIVGMSYLDSDFSILAPNKTHLDFLRYIYITFRLVVRNGMPRRQKESGKMLWHAGYKPARKSWQKGNAINHESQLKPLGLVRKRKEKKETVNLSETRITKSALHRNHIHKL